MIIHEIGSAYFIQFKVIPGPKLFPGNPNLRSCSLLIPSLSTFLIKAIKFGSSKVHPSDQAYIFGCVLQLKLYQLQVFHTNHQPNRNFNFCLWYITFTEDIKTQSCKLK